MNAKLIFNIVRKSIGDNAPTILSALGAVGVVSTGVLAAKAAPAAKKEVDLDILNNGEPKTKLESAGRKIKVTWRLYAPAVVAGSCAIICIAMAQHENLKRQAALIGAYSISSEAFKDYREKAEEALGKKKSGEINSELAAEQTAKNPRTENNTVILSNGTSRIYDSYTMQYIENGSLEAVRKAVNDYNQHLIAHGYADLNTFFDYVGFKNTIFGSEFGFKDNRLMEMDYDPYLDEDGRAGIMLRYIVTPMVAPWKNPMR